MTDTRAATEIYMAALKEILKPLVIKGECIITESGGSPRYGIIIKKRLFEKKGLYNLFVAHNERFQPSVINRDMWEKMLVICNKIISDAGLYNPRNDKWRFMAPARCISLVPGRRFKHFVKKAIEGGYAWYYAKDGKLYEGAITDEEAY